MLTCWLLLPYDEGHGETFVCQLLCCKLGEWLQEALKEVQVQSTCKAVRQKWYYDRMTNAISLETDDLVLAKADTYRRKRKVKDWWEEELYEVEHQVVEGVPLYLVKNSQQDTHESSTETDFFSWHLQRGLPFVLWCKLSRPAPPLTP